MKKALFSAEPIVAIDIGTTKICVLVAQQLSDKDIDIIGIGKAPSDGLKKGVVVDISRTMRSIKKAVQEAELMAGCSIETATIGISGSHIYAFNSHGAVPIKKSYVTNQDISNVLAAAQAVHIPEGQQVLHVLPQYFSVDGYARLHDPLGMHGIRLEAQVHIITGAVSSVQNLIRCCEDSGIRVVDVVLEHIGSGLAVLSEDERQLGVGILDIGGGTADLALFHNQNIFFTHVFPVAGNHFTHDLALGMRITLQEAERVKKTEASLFEQRINQHEGIRVESVEGDYYKDISIKAVNNIVQARAQELMYLVDEILKKNQLKPLIPAGLVLTGGGSLLQGFTYLAENVIKIPVRLGVPIKAEKLVASLANPSYATSYGLLLFSMQTEKQKALMQESVTLSSVATKMKKWIADFF